jgi:uncharacterized protein (DUF488 family)
MAKCGLPRLCRLHADGAIQKKSGSVHVLAKASPVVLMCAEAVPWRCHRSLVADALIVRGIAVSEITSGVRARPHALTPWAEVDGIQITYPDSTHARDPRHF